MDMYTKLLADEGYASSAEAARIIHQRAVIAGDELRRIIDKEEAIAEAAFDAKKAVEKPVIRGPNGSNVIKDYHKAIADMHLKKEADARGEGRGSPSPTSDGS